MTKLVGLSVVALIFLGSCLADVQLLDGSTAVRRVKRQTCSGHPAEATAIYKQRAIADENLEEVMTMMKDFLSTHKKKLTPAQRLQVEKNINKLEKLLRDGDNEGKDLAVENMRTFLSTLEEDIVTTTTVVSGKSDPTTTAGPPTTTAMTTTTEDWEWEEDYWDLSFIWDLFGGWW